MLSFLCNFEHSTNENNGLWPVPDQANQSGLDTYLINFQPLRDRSHIKLFNAWNGRINVFLLNPVIFILINGKNYIFVTKNGSKWNFRHVERPTAIFE